MKIPGRIAATLRIARGGATGVSEALEVRAMGERRRKFWGWGYEDEGPTHEQQERIAAPLAALVRSDCHVAKLHHPEEFKEDVSSSRTVVVFG